MKLAWVILLSLFSAPAFAGAIGGPRTGAANLGPGQSVTWTVAYDDKESSIAGITQHAAVPLVVEVTDESGFYVCGAAGNGTVLIAQWWWTGDAVYFITAKNISKNVATAVTLQTN